MILATYAPFEQMHGQKSTIPELVALLKRFSRESVLYTCAVTGIILKLWERGGWEQERYDMAIDSAFEFIRGDWYKLSSRFKEPELVFHRRQLLFLMKLAIEHCPERGLDLMKTPPGPFGTILLMANDHFHYGLHPSADADELENVCRVAAEFVPVNEYSGFRPVNKLVRAHLMMTKYSQELREHADFVDVAAQYERVTGIPLLDYEALVFALSARCTEQITLDALRSNAWIAAIRAENFSTTAIPMATVSAFFAEFASTPEELLSRLNSSQDRNRDFGANDFTLFRDKPLITERYGSLPCDVNLVIEKFESGPFWRISAVDKETGDKLRRFWGAVFEAYVNDVVGDSTSAVKSQFIPNPRLKVNPNIQVCDGLLVEGESLLVMEYKACMFTAAAKYSGDHLLLRREIERKLVHDSAEEKKKGVEQLSEAIQLLFADPNQVVVDGLDISRIRHVYPVLVTLDDIGASLMITKILNAYFTQTLRSNNIRGVQVRPLLCTDIESLETVLPHIHTRPLSGFLQHWLEVDPKLLGALLACSPPNLTQRRSEFVSKNWNSLSQRISYRLFPHEFAENAAIGS